MLRIKENKAISVANKDIGLEVNAEKTGHMYMFREKNRGKILIIKPTRCTNVSNLFLE
jgi:hypothetical protein